MRPLRFSPRAPTLLHAPPHSRRHPAATRPKHGDVPRATAGMLPERAIQQTFMWTDDWGETKRWSNEVIEAYARMLPEARFAARTLNPNPHPNLNPNPGPDPNLYPNPNPNPNPDPNPNPNPNPDLSPNLTLT